MTIDYLTSLLLDIFSGSEYQKRNYTVERLKFELKIAVKLKKGLGWLTGHYAKNLYLIEYSPRLLKGNLKELLLADCCNDIKERYALERPVKGGNFETLFIVYSDERIERVDEVRKSLMRLFSAPGESFLLIELNSNNLLLKSSDIAYQALNERYRFLNSTLVKEKGEAGKSNLDNELYREFKRLFVYLFEFLAFISAGEQKDILNSLD